MVGDIEDYVRSGFEVVGIVGVGSSPSCSVWNRLDRQRSLEAVAGCPLARLDRCVMNEEVVAACLSEGEGLFMAAIRNQLRRKHLNVRRYKYDLLCEIRGQPPVLRTKKG